MIEPNLLPDENGILQLKRILEKGIGSVGQYYDILGRKVLGAKICIQKGLELPGKVDINGFIRALTESHRGIGDGQEVSRFFCHKCYHLRRPNTFLYVYLDPISGKFIGIKKELLLNEAKEFERGSKLQEEAGLDGIEGGIRSRESILFELKLPKIYLKQLSTIDFKFGGHRYEIIALSDCLVRGDLVDLKATDMTRQTKLVEWMKQILRLYQKKFFRKKTKFFGNIDNILSCDYVYYFRIDIGNQYEFRIPICYLIFVKNFKNCEFEVLDLTAVIGGR